MAQITPIEWCDSAVNPVMGCDGCELAVPDRAGNTCYTWYLHERMGRQGQKGYADTFFEPKMFAGRMAIAALWPDLTGLDRPTKPWLNGHPRTIFVSDMGDALSERIGFSFLKAEIIENVITPAGRRHRWLWLTKRPQRMAFFDRWLESQGIAWPENLWAMTSVTSQRFIGRVRDLMKVRAAVLGLSCEPLLGAVQLPAEFLALGQHAWVITGYESGQNARPGHPNWATDIRDDCTAACVPFFHKQNGDWLQRTSGVMSMQLLMQKHQRHFRITDAGENGSILGAKGDDHAWMGRVGKKAAGRLLDGREHNEFPQPLAA